MSKLFRRHLHPDDLDNNGEQNSRIDDDLQLRTVMTAASTIAESIRSEQRAQRRKTHHRKGSTRSRFFGRGSLKGKEPSRPSQLSVVQQQQALTSKPRRNIYVNAPLSPQELRPNGDPWVRYVRNKVRTSKYTIITFIPKNLYEQFRRVANLYFLALVCIQVFPIFGAAAPSIAMLPLAFILTVTAIKDGIEDYRRARLDEVVNTSAATKLGSWRNVNQPLDARNWFQRLFGMNKPGSVTKGVRRLRERDKQGLHITLERAGTRDDDESSMASLGVVEPTHIRLDDIQSVSSAGGSHSHPADKSKIGLPIHEFDARDRSNTLTSSKYPQSNISRVSAGVVDWNRPPAGGNARWERTLWKKLEVGDVVLLRENDQVPADIVVLSTSDSDGLCFVETKNLDGETNLKPRRALRATTSITSEEDVEHASFVIDSEPPHANLYLYNGVLRYTEPSGVDKLEPVTINELLLRGCAVRNTQWIIGLVVFTGADTKIMLNGGDTPSKRSKIEKETNFNVIMNFVVLFCMCLTTAGVSGYYDVKQGTSARFFEAGSDPTRFPVVNSLVTFASCLIAFQNIVPISLYISIEIVKTIQAYFISQDIDMYYAPYDTACVPKTWNISDDLGQIEYIFSDKTGTLTQNIMEFQKCSVQGICYGEGVTEAQRGAMKRLGQEQNIEPAEQQRQLDALKDDMIQKMNRTFKNRYLRSDKLTLISPTLADHLADRSSQQRGHLIAFFRALAICHSVLSDRPDASQPFLLDYKAESPDEAALVGAARDVGFPFVQRSSGAIDIEVMGQTERYTPLRVLEFNSTRKRMSVIVRNPEGKLVLYCKGADSVVYERLSKHQDPQLKEATSRNMEDFANGGLRTLCVAYKYLSDEEYLEWVRVFDAANSSIEDRDEEIDKANELIEQDLLILGATALEDKLQEGVPEAIETLHKAGIKLWILTGDKLQTAIEIGFSCNLLKQNMEIMILSADSAVTARAQIEAGLNKVASILGPQPVTKDQNRGFIPGAQKAFAVVIDGNTLRYALDSDLKPLFLALGTQCETVVCCRVSPAQKALTVKLIKDGCNAMTLSIGDGANDVAMIQEANIGCGLFGLEGSQAAMSADYAFGQFRYLTKLLLVHGRWSYLRIADMHSNFFYKNVIWTFAMFWFLFYNSFDATYLYEYTFILLYNLIFTSLPVISLGAFDQDVNARASLAFPQMYIRGIRGLDYTRFKFWTYMLDGLYQSAVVYFIPYCVWALDGVPASWNGRALDSLGDFGTTVSVAAIFSANIYVGINTHYWTIITWVIIIGSNVVMLLWIGLYSLVTSIGFTHEFVQLLGTVNFWGTVLLSVVLAIGPRFLVKYVSTSYYPLDRDLVREMWVKGNLKDKLGIKHRRDRGKGDPENVPMFNPQYSSSQASSIDGDSPAATPGARGLDVPVGAHSPPFAETSDSPATRPQKLTPPSLDVTSRHDVADGDDVWDEGVTPIARRPSREQAISRASYYSVSDLPPESPLPAENLYSPTSPRSTIITSSLTSAPAMREFSAQQMQPPTHPTESSRQTPLHSPQLFVTPLQSPAPHISPTHTQHTFPRVAAYPGEYEMRVPSTSQNPQPFDRAQSQASHITEYTEASFATARETGDGGHDSFPEGRVPQPSYEDDPGIIPHGEDGSNPWRHSDAASEYTLSGPHAL